MKPYEGLSQVYDGKWSIFSRLYKGFLCSAADQWAVPMERVLDLACGTGMLMSFIKKRCGSLSGLDISSEMLQKARQRLNDDSIELVNANFCDFSFQEPFDLIILCFDSINYINDFYSLSRLLECVGKNLKKNGYFIFDFLNEQHFLNLSSQPDSEDVINGIHYFNHMSYDKKEKKFTSSFIFNHDLKLIEEHCEIPIELDEMKKLLNDGGFELCDVSADFGKKKIDRDTTRFFCTARLR